VTPLQLSRLIAEAAADKKAREVVRLVQGDLPRIVDQCSEIMTGEAELYQLKDAIVRVTEGGRLAPVEPEWIVDRLQRLIAPHPHVSLFVDGQQGHGWNQAAVERQTDVMLDFFDAGVRC